uniref:CobQ/CobB/MinD/ParA nucleotide binding domain-containing protein n=1 Tax=Candidatus Kentrum sp. MB TaxID=2138164 RepID=A0A450XT16_9GAMM|nr:MAG: CobQ/CobB/MinD/ParA nucleotide binding domain-containing protein [Candidatus Kentron sp. MB]
MNNPTNSMVPDTVDENREPLYVSFYSFKGGVGRSMCLANVAAMLASLFRKKVLVIDWDLEAPGLPYYFGYEYADFDKGFTEYLLDRFVHEEDRIHLDEIIFPVKNPSNIENRLRIIFPGCLDEDYLYKMRRVTSARVSEGRGGFRIRERLRSDIAAMDWKPDFVLLDSRAGVTPQGDVATFLAPDITLMFIGTYGQSLDWTVHQLANYLRSDPNPQSQSQPQPRTRMWEIPPLQLLPIPSRVTLNSKAQVETLNRYVQTIAEAMSDSREIREKCKIVSKSYHIPFDPNYAWGELLAFEQEEAGGPETGPVNSSLYIAYQHLARLLLDYADSREQDVQDQFLLLNRAYDMARPVYIDPHYTLDMGNWSRDILISRDGGQNNYETHEAFAVAYFAYEETPGRYESSNAMNFLILATDKCRKLSEGNNQNITDYFRNLTRFFERISRSSRWDEHLDVSLNEAYKAIHGQISFLEAMVLYIHASLSIKLRSSEDGIRENLLGKLGEIEEIMEEIVKKQEALGFSKKKDFLKDHTVPERLLEKAGILRESLDPKTS